MQLFRKHPIELFFEVYDSHLRTNRLFDLQEQYQMFLNRIYKPSLDKTILKYLKDKNVKVNSSNPIPFGKLLTNQNINDELMRANVTSLNIMSAFYSLVFYKQLEELAPHIKINLISNNQNSFIDFPQNNISLEKQLRKNIPNSLSTSKDKYFRAISQLVSACAFYQIVFLHPPKNESEFDFIGQPIDLKLVFGKNDFLEQVLFSHIKYHVDFAPATIGLYKSALEVGKVIGKYPVFRRQNDSDLLIEGKYLPVDRNDKICTTDHILFTDKKYTFLPPNFLSKEELVFEILNLVNNNTVVLSFYDEPLIEKYKKTFNIKSEG